MTQESSDEPGESDHSRNFLCLLGLHDWRRKSGALCCRPTVLEKRYECVRCGKYKVVFEQEKILCKGENAL